MFASRTDWDQSINAYTRVLNELRAQDRPLSDLTISNPTEAGLVYPGEAQWKALAKPEAMNYQPQAQGLLSARESVARYYAERQPAAKVDPNDIFLTTSTSEAYTWLFRLLCEEGTEVLVPQPSYPLFSFLADLCDVTLVPYPLIYDHGWQIDLYSLEAAITPATRAILCVHPNNPTGSCGKTEERERLNEICNERELALIVDEVFLDYPLEAPPAESFATNHSALTFTLSGISKVCGLPQMKAAWIVASGPKNLREQAHSRLEVIADTYLSLSTPQQIALPEWLNSRHPFQGSLLNRLKTNLFEADTQLNAARSIRRLHVDAGWYITVRLPALHSDEETAIHLMEEHGVIVQPGHFFEFPQDGYMVVSLMTPEEQFKEGMRKLLK